jgi:hypothetical protein
VNAWWILFFIVVYVACWYQAKYTWPKKIKTYREGISQFRQDHPQAAETGVRILANFVRWILK